MVEYYSQRAAEYEQIYERNDPARRRELGELSQLIRDTFKGRRVLEVACGTGFWTKVLLEVAEHVLAIDASPSMLELARLKMGEQAKVRFQEADAYDLDAASGDFDAGLANFWFSHVPRARIQAFLESFHRRVGSRAVVLMADNMNVPGIGGELVCPVGSRDTYKIRRLKDGSSYQVVKNYYTRDELEGLFAPYSTRLEAHCGTAYWWVRYLVR